MSRFKHYSRSLLSSYLLMGVNVLYTLAQIPFALKYLSQAEFGVWALSLQVATYLAMIDLGMGSSIARILIDYKDRRLDGSYGGAIQSAFLVGIAQALIVFVVGFGMASFLGMWLHVPSDLNNSFFWLMIGQVLITGAMLGTRLFVQILYAWQRMDISNYAAMLNLASGLIAMAVAFNLKCGIFSLLIGSAIGWFLGTALNAVACVRLKLLPSKGAWGSASRERFKELFAYGTDVFMISIGGQLIMASQVILISRQLGVDTAAIWTAMTKVFTVLSQLVLRIIGNAMPAFAEMQVRQERETLLHRYRTMFITVTVLSAISATIFAACNGPFTKVWLSGRFSWPHPNDWILGAWLMLLTQQYCHSGLIMCLKEIRALKYVYLIEGGMFILTAAWALPRFNITGLLFCSIIATMCFTVLYGSWRVCSLIGGAAELLRWQKPALKVLAIMVSICLCSQLMTANLSPLLQFVILGTGLGIVGVVLLVLFLPKEIVTRVGSRLPGWLRHRLPVFVDK